MLGEERQMRYLLLAYGDRHRASDRAGGDTILGEGGYLLAAQSLGDGASVTTVRALDTGLRVDVGPLQGASAALLAIFVIETHDLNDAIRLTAMLPEAHHGPVEIWPVQDLGCPSLL
jgi:hypothetical protein